MKMRYDEQADAFYLRLDDSTIIESEEVQLCPSYLLRTN
ncbi:MAG: DUF2283 domain-containing protein [Gammaproteobacteria bacterium]